MHKILNNYRYGAMLFTGFVMVSFFIGDYILNTMFFGIIMLVSLVVVIESIKSLKWLLARTSKVIDLIIFIATIFATASLGLNITAGLTVAGLGYTLIYAPYLRENKDNIQFKKKSRSARPNRK